MHQQVSQKQELSSFGDQTQDPTPRRTKPAPDFSGVDNKQEVLTNRKRCHIRQSWLICCQFLHTPFLCFLCFLYLNLAGRQHLSKDCSQTARWLLILFIFLCRNCAILVLLYFQHLVGIICSQFTATVMKHSKFSHVYLALKCMLWNKGVFKSKTNQDFVQLGARLYYT